MKKLFESITSIILVLFIFSCNKKIFLQEGVISINKNFTNDINDENVLTRIPLENKIWFLDSFLIHEIKVLQTFTDEAEGIRTESYEVFKYSFQNLKTNLCQDYLHLSDTALPKCNYFLSSNEAITFRFKKDTTEWQNIKAIYIPQSDTTINKKKYKRFRKVDKYSTFSNIFDYFLEEKKIETIFHLNNQLDNHFEKLKVTRTESGDDISPAKIVNEYSIIQKGLTDKEKKIFTTWIMNAENTTLPVLKYSECQKICGPPIYVPKEYKEK